MDKNSRNPNVVYLHIQNSPKMAKKEIVQQVSRNCSIFNLRCEKDFTANLEAIFMFFHSLLRCRNVFQTGPFWPNIDNYSSSVRTSVAKRNSNLIYIRLTRRYEKVLPPSTWNPSGIKQKAEKQETKKHRDRERVNTRQARATPRTM